MDAGIRRACCRVRGGRQYFQAISESWPGLAKELMAVSDENLGGLHTGQLVPAGGSRCLANSVKHVDARSYGDQLGGPV